MTRLTRLPNIFASIGVQVDHRRYGAMVMRTFRNPNTSPDVPRTDALKPALASIPNACKYMGDVSRAKFYSDLLPLLETIHIGTRHFVIVASLDRLIATLLEAKNALPETVEGSATPKAARLHEP